MQEARPGATTGRGGERMQRVRIGLTGLACVFLLVLLAAAFFGLTNDERETGRLVVAPADVPVANGADGQSPREPLAELGVAPGYSPDAAPDAAPDNVMAAPAPEPLPAPAADATQAAPSPPPAR